MVRRKSRPQKPSPDSEKKPGWERFIGLFGLGFAILIPLLQTNGVDVNWWQSLLAYSGILAFCLWSFLWQTVPDLKRKKLRYGGAFLILVSVGSLGAFATLKQYERDYTDNLRAVRIVDVTVRQEVADSAYLFLVSVENLTDQDMRGSMMCVVAKPNYPVKPFGIFTGSATKEHEFEDYLFRRVDDAEDPTGETTLDLPAQKTVYGYCRSSWFPTKDEITRLEHGEFVLCVAGRVSIPSKTRGAHVDIDFCRVGDQNFGLQNCFGHNVPNVHHPHKR
jgi:hypothetical protein